MIFEGQPFEVVGYAHSHVGRGGAVVQVKIRNLITGNVFDRSFKPSDKFEEAEITKRKALFLYNHRGQYVFQNPEKHQERSTLDENLLGAAVSFLKPKLEVELWEFEGKLIKVKTPIKVDLEVTEAPPGERGNTAQGGSKKVMVETGYQLNVPFFIATGDIIRINTETKEYVERVAKAA